MKKYMAMLLAALCLSGVLMGCEKEPAQPEVSEAAFEAPDEGFGVSADVFVDALEVSVPQWREDGSAAEAFCDITTKAAAEEIGCQVFRETNTHASYVYYEENVYPLGEWVGGQGVVDLQVSDLNADGTPELLYAYSYSGEKRLWQVGLFDFADMSDRALVSALYDGYRMMTDVVLEKKNVDSFEINTVKFGDTNGSNPMQWPRVPMRWIGRVERVNNAPKVWIGTLN